jgi:L-fuconolactonase
MNIDSHQHFWRYNEREYGWMGPGMEVLKEDHLPPDLLPLLQSAGVGGTLAVQARQVLEETRWLLNLSEQFPFIKGVVGWVDLRSPQLRQQLEQLAAHPKLRGVRHVVQDEPDDQFMLREDFVRGIGLLSEFGLAYDLLLFPKHLPKACELVKQFPGQRFVLDHIAKPHIKDGLVEPWAADLRKLAAFPNVCAKVSGMVTEANWRAWKPSDFAPYLDVVFEAFGTKRIMIGSDWPVCTVAAAYRQVMSIVTDYIGKFSLNEQKMILGENAHSFYRIQA